MLKYIDKAKDDDPDYDPFNDPDEWEDMDRDAEID
jgi:hypothetical protein